MLEYCALYNIGEGGNGDIGISMVKAKSRKRLPPLHPPTKKQQQETGEIKALFLGGKTKTKWI